MLGAVNDRQPPASDRVVMFDEFNFWSTYFAPQQVPERGAQTAHILNHEWEKYTLTFRHFVAGPIFLYQMPMEAASGSQIMTLNRDFQLQAVGGAGLSPNGKVGRACQLNGRGQYLDGGSCSVFDVISIS